MDSNYDFNKVPENKKEFELWLKKITAQEVENNRTGKITCICEITYQIGIMYRCYYCGLWLCPVCAKKHFGKRPKGEYTYKEYIFEQKKIEIRKG